MGADYESERDLNDYIPGDIQDAVLAEIHFGYGRADVDADPELGITRIVDKNIGKTVIDSMQAEG
jgi:hypothetical protein